jgi:hypothetical protein
MRGVTSFLAGLLSLLLVLASTSASVCDLSCSLKQVHSRCQTTRATPTVALATESMSSDMDMMGAKDTENMPAPELDMDAMPDHSGFMSSGMQMAPERFENATEPETSANTPVHHSKAVPSCAHGPCTQTSASASSSSGDSFEPSLLQWIANTVASPVSARIGFCRMETETPPPKILAADRLTTTLRI